MHSMRTLDIYICDRCGEQMHSDSEEPIRGWLVATVALIEAQTATTTHHLCPDCREDVGRFLAGSFVPPIPDYIEQPFEALTPEDFVPVAGEAAPWECNLMSDGHVWGWDRYDGVFMRRCSECGLLFQSAQRIGEA